MDHRLLQQASFWTVLFSVDQDLAGNGPSGRLLVRRAFCIGLTSLGSRAADRRICRRSTVIGCSFCCDREGCRKRVTPPSVRFLGRKVYLHAVIILVAAMRQGATPRRVHELSELFGARPTDHRPLAGLLAGAVSADRVLEGRTRTSCCRW